MKMKVSFMGVSYTFVIPLPNEGESNQEYHDRVNALNPDVKIGGSFSTGDMQKTQALVAWTNKMYYASFGINYPVE